MRSVYERLDLLHVSIVNDILSKTTFLLVPVNRSGFFVLMVHFSDDTAVRVELTSDWEWLQWSATVNIDFYFHSLADLIHLLVCFTAQQIQRYASKMWVD